MGNKEKPEFDPDIAFSRTVGFVTRDELKALRGKTIAIAGLGGVGGSHLLTLTRLGIGGFHLADFDTFGIENFNRQAGANMKTIGRSKLEVMREKALEINPDLRIRSFPQGVTTENVDEFFSGVDAYVDGLDFFAFKIRAAVFKTCHEKNIPAVTVAPIGCGAGLLSFMPGQMSFQDYFQWKETDSEAELAVKFLVGVAPSLPQSRYLVDPTAMRLSERAGPSTPMGCELCAGVAGSEILKILLNRGTVKAAPHSIHFDAFLNKLFSRHIWLGNRNPVQRFKIAMGLKRIAKAQKRQ